MKAKEEEKNSPTANLDKIRDSCYTIPTKGRSLYGIAFVQMVYQKPERSLQPRRAAKIRCIMRDFGDLIKSSVVLRKIARRTSFRLYRHYGRRFQQLVRRRVFPDYVGGISVSGAKTRPATSLRTRTVRIYFGAFGFSADLVDGL